MTNKLAVIIKSLNVPEIKKILLYEMKLPVPNYSCLQNPWLGGYRPQIPVLSVLCQLILLKPPPRTKFLGTPLSHPNHWGFRFASTHNEHGLVFWSTSVPVSSFCSTFRRGRQKLRKARPSAWNNSAHTRQIFMKFHIWVFFENLSRKFKFH